MSATGGVDLYRTYGTQCLELARKAPDLETRLALLNMAQAWVVLAEQADKNSHAPTFVYETPEQQQPVIQQQQQPQPDTDKDD